LYKPHLLTVLSHQGLPRVLENTLPSFLSSKHQEENEIEDDWKLFGEYLEGGARINLNVRQVFPS
jgi:alkylated DNA repair protein alkB family protein 1